jgi:hypothetical protein
LVAARFLPPLLDKCLSIAARFTVRLRALACVLGFLFGAFLAAFFFVPLAIV